MADYADVRHTWRIMKQLGITFFILAILYTVFSYFSLKGIVWEFLFVLIWILALIWIPDFKRVLSLKLHWRIALLLATLCTFWVVWKLVEVIVPSLQDYSLSITLVFFGMLAFLFSVLDNQKDKATNQ